MAETKSDVLETIGSSLFWIIQLGIIFATLIYLAIYAQTPQVDSVRIIAMVVIFGFMAILGVVMTLIYKGLNAFTNSSWSGSSLSYILAFLTYLTITTKLTGKTYSVFSVSRPVLFSSVISELPRYLDFILTSILIPIAEELFWMFGVTFISMAILQNIAKKVKFLDNLYIQLAITSLISGITFGVFHVGKASPIFLFAAILFRVVMAWIVFGDIKFNILPFITIVPAFALGSHQGNNWGNFGWASGWQIVNQFFYSWGWIVYAIGGAVLLGALNKIVIMITEGNSLEKFGGWFSGGYILTLITILIL